MTLRLGTRASLLATTQSGRVAAALEALGHPCELVTISTLGDRVTDKPFAEVGAPGVFVREIEQALLDWAIDLAVHSYKDLPTASPEGLIIGAVSERLDPADVLVVDEGSLVVGNPGELPLPLGARVGTSSSRRMALLQDLRPDLEMAPLRHCRPPVEVLPNRWMPSSWLRRALSGWSGRGLPRGPSCAAFAARGLCACAVPGALAVRFVRAARPSPSSAPRPPSGSGCGGQSRLYCAVWRAVRRPLAPASGLVTAAPSGAMEHPNGLKRSVVTGTERDLQTR